MRSLSEDAGMLIVQDGHRAGTVDASHRLGLLGPRTLLSHAVDLDESQIELLARTGTSVAHNPTAIYSQFGRCPVPELMTAGVTVGLGSDATAPDRSADMFRHMFQLTRYHHDPIGVIPRCFRPVPLWSSNDRGGAGPRHGRRGGVDRGG